MAAPGYPAKPLTGTAIEGFNADGQLDDAPDVQIFHAGTTRSKDGKILTSGGRVLGVTASAATLPMAVSRAYQAVERIHFEGAQFRRDIAARALKRPK
jgi:phosphoribosylamine--glycine ligase